MDIPSCNVDSSCSSSNNYATCTCSYESSIWDYVSEISFFQKLLFFNY